MSLEYLQAWQLWAPSLSQSFQVSRALGLWKGQALATASQGSQLSERQGLMVRHGLPRQQIKDLLQKMPLALVSVFGTTHLLGHLSPQVISHQPDWWLLASNAV